jgi:hypothetical protein
LPGDEAGYVRDVTPEQVQPPDSSNETDTSPTPEGDDRRERSRRVDPDAPGNYVDDETSAEVPEPNEPG